MNCLELLTPELLEDDVKLNEIDHWLNIMNRVQGWHYDMDIIWLLRELEKAGIKKGSTILDAGAGLGATQFVLAARGYNVISLDFSRRKFPILSRDIFDIEINDQDSLEYKHDYIGYVKYEENKSVISIRNRVFYIINKLLELGPQGILYRVKHRLRERENQRLNSIEKTKEHQEFGKIEFIRAAFHEIPLKDAAVDALVSVSAIEHADKNILEKNISEMKRVVKKDGLLLITTSATRKKEDWFHEKTRGWCFSKESLRKIIGSDLYDNYNPELAEEKILSSDIWRKRIDPYYVNDSESEFYQRKIQSLPYLPVGLKIIRI
jgi:ubiquinone/menaquinone biosynthesis C-methylase UbiE